MTTSLPARLPVGWTAKEFADLHPLLVAAIIPALLEAETVGLRMRRNSGWRSNAHQQHLRDTYDEALARWKAAGGEASGKRKPLPASPPGSSAHNFTLCSKDASHGTVGVDDVCPVCGAAVVPASAGLDVQAIEAATGRAIMSGGQVPLSDRHECWQRWAAVLDRHPLLRDGGDFKNVDMVHVEYVGWDRATKTVREAPPVAGPSVDVERARRAAEPSAALGAALRPRRKP